MKIRALLFPALLALSSCGRCGSGSTPASTSAAPSASAPSATAPEAAPSGSAAAPPAADVPEVKDTGPGRATAALRAALTLYELPFDAAALEKECDVDEEGASIDDLEDAAEHLGLDVRQILAPREHVLLPEAGLLPAIAIVEGLEDPESADFVLLQRIEGDRVRVMDPIHGRRWVPRAELAKSLFVDEITIAAEDWHGAETDPRFQDALRTRAASLGAPADRAKALVESAAGDPGSKALGALDAALRKLEADAAPAAGDAGGFLEKAVACAREGCATPAWSARDASARAAGKGPDGQPQVAVKAAVLLVIAGKKPAP
jgi:predicted double-glycine peptidase